MSSRFVLPLIIVSILSAATPGQEWIKLPDGTPIWARPAATLVPQSAPIVLKTANLRQILSKAWLMGGQPAASLAPGGALIELARILNTGPGLKALHLNRPIYAGLYQPLSLSELRANASMDAITNTLGEMVIAVPIASEKRFWRSLDARFQAVESPIPELRQYRLQADHMDYEAWTRAVLEEKIDPSKVGPEGFARAGNDILYCRSNGLYVAMTSNFELAKQIAKITDPQGWIALQQPERAPTTTTSRTLVSNSMGAENFLAPNADLCLNFRLIGENAMDHRLLRSRLSAFLRRLVQDPDSNANEESPNLTLDTLSSTISELLGTDFSNLKKFEVSLDLLGQKFDLGIRMLTAESETPGGSPPPIDDDDEERPDDLERVPNDVLASGWVDVRLGARIKKIYMDLAVPFSGFSWFPMVASDKAKTLVGLPANKFAYSMNYDAKAGFSFAEWYRPQDFSLNRITALKQFKTKTLLGRTTAGIAPDQSLSWVRTLDRGEGPIYLYRFANRQGTLQWNRETTLESTMNRLAQHAHPIVITRWQGLLISICAEHPLDVLKDTCAFLKQASGNKSKISGFDNPQIVELDGQLRPTDLQEFLVGATPSAAEALGVHDKAIRYVIGHDQEVRRLHLRGDVAVLRNLSKIRSRSQDQGRKIQTRQRMVLLRRSVIRFLAERGASQETLHLTDLFTSSKEHKAILPSLYRFALEDSWGNDITLQRNQDGSLSLLSLGADKVKDKDGKSDDMVLKIM